MRRQRSHIQGLILTASSLFILALTACTTIPQKEFGDYRAAFAGVKDTTEQLLTEYDAARRTEAEKAGQNEPAPATQAPYPARVALDLDMSGASSSDPVAVRRQALETLSSFNDALVVLAEGRSPEQVRSSVEGLVGSVDKLSTLLGAASAIPFAGQITALTSTFLAELNEAQNRQQFVAAMREGRPIIRSLLSLFATDAETIYAIRARQADLQWGSYQDQVATSVRRMRRITREYKAPSQEDLAKGLQRVREGARDVLDGVGLTNNTSALPTGGEKVFDELALAQLEEMLAQAKEAQGKYEAVIAEQLALEGLVKSYGVLLSRTDASVSAVLAQLDAPTDIHAEARELVAFAFTVRRNWDALNEARRQAR